MAVVDGTRWRTMSGHGGSDGGEGMEIEIPEGNGDVQKRWREQGERENKVRDSRQLLARAG